MIYTVKRGDTLSAIARANGVSLQNIINSNAITNPNLILVGQQLIIPESQSNQTYGATVSNQNTSNQSKASVNKSKAYPRELAAFISAEGLVNFWNKLDSSLTAQQKAGILGNMIQESQLKPTAKNSKGYYGLVQLSPALQKLFRNYYGTLSLDNQIKYVNDYVTGKMPAQFTGNKVDWTGNMGYKQKAYRAGNHRTAADSASTFLSCFERTTEGARKRRNYATLIYNYMTSGSTVQNQVPSDIWVQEEQPDALRVTTSSMNRFGGYINYFKI